jgi:hypothetical protein
MEDQLPSARGRIDGFGDALKSNAQCFELLNLFNQVLERAAKSIQPPNHEGIARAQRFEQAKQFRPVHFAAGFLFFVRALAPRKPEGISLQIEVLVVAADPCITDFHGTSVPEVGALSRVSEY